jgi:hypothetical protein
MSGSEVSLGWGSAGRTRRELTASQAAEHGFDVRWSLTPTIPQGERELARGGQPLAQQRYRFFCRVHVDEPLAIAWPQ